MTLSASIDRRTSSAIYRYPAETAPVHSKKVKKPAAGPARALQRISSQRGEHTHQHPPRTPARPPTHAALCRRGTWIHPWTGTWPKRGCVGGCAGVRGVGADLPRSTTKHGPPRGGWVPRPLVRRTSTFRARGSTTRESCSRPRHCRGSSRAFHARMARHRSTCPTCCVTPAWAALTRTLIGILLCGTSATGQHLHTGQQRTYWT